MSHTTNNYTTNIFCIIANAGNDQELYIKHILSERSFNRETRLSRLIFNTTKPVNIDKSKYKYYSLDKFQSIDPGDIIDSRSYYTIKYDTIYYFTLISDITDKDNLICIASPYQYENYKRYIDIESIKYPNKFKLNAIVINSSLKERFKNTLSNIDSYKDTDILEFCRRVLQDNAEFKDACERLPELNDPMNCSNVCFINHQKNNFDDNVRQIRNFILNKVNYT